MRKASSCGGLAHLRLHDTSRRSGTVEHPAPNVEPRDGLVHPMAGRSWLTFAWSRTEVTRDLATSSSRSSTIPAGSGRDSRRTAVLLDRVRLRTAKRSLVGTIARDLSHRRVSGTTALAGNSDVGSNRLCGLDTPFSAKQGDGSAAGEWKAVVVGWYRHRGH